MDREKRFEKSGSRNQVREIWFKKTSSANLDFFSGSRKVVDQKNRWIYTMNPAFFRLEKSGSSHSDFFSGSRKVVDQKKNPSLQNHFSKNHFSTLFNKSGCRLNGPLCSAAAFQKQEAAK